MTQKEKAKELVDKYYHLFSVKLENTIADYEAIECALIAVDEIITALENHEWQNKEIILEYKKLQNEIINLEL